MTSATIVRLPQRSEVEESDTWDLSKLFADDNAWDKGFEEFEELISGYEKFRGTLSNSAAELAACLDFDSSADRLAERLIVELWSPGPCRGAALRSPAPRQILPWGATDSKKTRKRSRFRISALEPHVT